MKRALLIVVVAFGALALAGCSEPMPEEQMREVASARDTCVELGGTFRQWYGVYNDVQWDCQFEAVSDE